MPTYLKSMNHGKAIAQGSHASNAFVHKMQNDYDKLPMFTKWANETRQGFGTVLVLGIDTKNHFETLMNTAISLSTTKEMSSQLVADYVTDPTYPIRDGYEETHYIEYKTCGYIFVDKEGGHDINGMLDVCELY